MLFHSLSYVYDRNTSPSREGREDSMDALKAEVTEAWKRRRKKETCQEGRHCRQDGHHYRSDAGTAAILQRTLDLNP
jgi:hypothetical protein